MKSFFHSATVALLLSSAFAFAETSQEVIRLSPKQGSLVDWKQASGADIFQNNSKGTTCALRGMERQESKDGIELANFQVELGRNNLIISKQNGEKASKFMVRLNFGVTDVTGRNFGPLTLPYEAEFTWKENQESAGYVMAFPLTQRAWLDRILKNYQVRMNVMMDTEKGFPTAMMTLEKADTGKIVEQCAQAIRTFVKWE
jgi:hypothetical protein